LFELNELLESRDEAVKKHSKNVRKLYVALNAREHVVPAIQRHRVADKYPLPSVTPDVEGISISYYVAKNSDWLHIPVQFRESLIKYYTRPKWQTVLKKSQFVHPDSMLCLAPDETMPLWPVVTRAIAMRDFPDADLADVVPWFKELGGSESGSTKKKVHLYGPKPPEIPEDILSKLKALKKSKDLSARDRNEYLRLVIWRNIILAWNKNCPMKDVVHKGDDFFKIHYKTSRSVPDSASKEIERLTEELRIARELLVAVAPKPEDKSSAARDITMREIVVQYTVPRGEEVTPETREVHFADEALMENAVSQPKKAVDPVIVNRCRTALGLSPAVSNEAVGKMTKEERKAYFKSITLPSWALRALLRDPANLARIESGDLNSSNCTRPSTTKKEKSLSPQADWVKVKAKFTGVHLCSNPHTKREKDLLHEYQRIKRDVGKEVARTFLPKIANRADKIPTVSASPFPQAAQPVAGSGMTIVNNYGLPAVGATVAPTKPRQVKPAPVPSPSKVPAHKARVPNTRRSKK